MDHIHNMLGLYMYVCTPLISLDKSTQPTVYFPVDIRGILLLLQKLQNGSIDSDSQIHVSNVLVAS